MRDWPGAINYANQRGHFHGTAAGVFISAEGNIADQMNKFFKEHPGLLVVDIIPLNGAEVLVLFTNVLDAQELQEFNEVSAEVEELRRKRREARQAAEAKALEAGQAAAKQAEADKAKNRERELELIKQGERCRKHHAHLDKKGKA